VPNQDLGLEPADLTAQRLQLSSYAMESRSGMVDRVTVSQIASASAASDFQRFT
jgi:hypothetical protein